MDIAPALCSTDTKLLLMDRYETAFGICNHDALGNTRPLLLIAMHPNEDASKDSMMYDRIYLFAKLQVGKFFNLSLTEFLEYPRDICTRLLEISEQMQKTEGNVITDTLNNLENRSKT